MTKYRLEALSDAVFAIVMTLLIIEIHVPELHEASNMSLAYALYDLIPLIASYFVSFSVLAMFWLSHNFFYSTFTKNINRQMTLLNIVYLSFIAFIPFSTHLIGAFPNVEFAVMFYGLNVLAIGVLAVFILRYAIVSHEIEISEVSPRLMKQAKIRMTLTPVCTAIGIAAAPIWIPLAMFFYAFPIVFNLVPGTLDFMEKRFGLMIDPPVKK